jgi:hypothetical protein
MLKKDDLELIKHFYKGFLISEPVGNNAFSFEKRKHKTLFVPPLKYGNLDELCISKDIVFSEIKDGLECNLPGLASFLYLYKDNKHIFIFDNHNHAFFFWSFGFIKGYLKKPLGLVHVDQHTDMREPMYYLNFKDNGNVVDKVFDYTNNVLNVGNFIKPALALGFFDQVTQVNREDAFSSEMPKEFVLDIDMDIFADEMKYISDHLKMEKIKFWFEKASWITIATSPFFMDQQKAIKLVKDILE